MFIQMRLLCVALVVLLMSTVLTPLNLQAQTDTTSISVALPEYIGSNLGTDLFSQFETDHPGVKVNIVNTGNDSDYPPAAYDKDKFVSGATHYVNSADVLYVSSYDLSEEATRAGYYLNLAPFVTVDTALNADDFVPAIWQSFQWDTGTWALPISADVVLLSYDPAAFDKAGLAHPDGKWTIDDLANAARKLAQKDADGKIVQPGILAYNSGVLFRSLLGEGFYDNSALPNPPKFDNPSLIPLLDTWSKLQADGLTGANFRGDYNAVPLRIDQSYAIAIQSGDAKPRAGALLPGGKAGLSVDGFAVSGGTQHPDLAYALTKFMVSDAKIASHFNGLRLARKSLASAVTASNTPRYTPKFSAANQAIIDQAFANALPVSEYRYSDYVSKALNDMQDKKLDAAAALQTEQMQAMRNLQALTDKRSTQNLAVVPIATPPPLKAGEVALNFGLVAYISPLPNRDRWNQVIKDFVSSDPQVKQIVLNTGSNASFNDLIAKNDCLVLPYNPLASADVSKLLDLTPLLETDASFDKKDVIGNSLTQLQQNNKIWGFPLYLQPQVLRYNSTLFTHAGLALPQSGWTVDQFNDALKAFKMKADDPAPFIPRQYGATYLLMLIASYGGLPLDTRTEPPTVNFTDPTNIDAIRQVLDLAKKGYIQYQKLNGNGFNTGGEGTEPIYTDSLSLLNFRPNGGDNIPSPYRLVAYPKGTRYVPAAYDVGAAYISAQTANAQTCYRWISTLSKHAELFLAMPARRSFLDSPGITAQGADVVAFYKAFDAQTQDSSTLSFSTQNSSAGTFILEYFLNRAFDRYVLEDANLETELKQAEDFAKGYQGCIVAIPPSSATTQQEMIAYYKQFTDCALKIDPTLKSVFSPNS